MMSVIDHNDFVYRNCPICDSGDNELIETIDGIVFGVNYRHRLYANLAVCKKCGFIFNNPSIRQSEYNEYYNDNLPVFEPESSYSVDNRMTLIKKYSSGMHIIAEIGGNEQGAFKNELEKMFDKYVSYDVGKQYNNTVGELGDIGTVDIVVAYYVLEHVLDLNTFLETIYNNLNDNGIVIFEVPDANKYFRDDTGLLALEHVSHFTPNSMTRLMQKYGFDLIEITRSFTSRDEGFVGVFRKSKEIKALVYDSNIDYLMGESILNDSLFRYHDNLFRLSSMCDLIIDKVSDSKIAFWCANDVLRSIIDCICDAGYEFDTTIIDENPLKHNYYNEYIAFTSAQLVENNKWNDIKEIYICSEIRIDSILRTIKKMNHNEIKIYYIDKNWNIIDITYKLH